MKRMSTIIALALLMMTNRSQAQDYALPAKTYSLSIFAGNYGYDAGVGIEAGSPCIQNTGLCFRVKGTLLWLEQYKAVTDRWAAYRSLNVSTVYNIYTFERSRVYIELGTYFIFPDVKFSHRKSIQGVSGSTGVEAFITTNPNFHMCYYFSGGIGYIRAYADKLENKPRYGNGFVFNNGFRFYF
jgi:hypothetical protein